MPDRVKLLGQTYRDESKLVNAVARHLLIADRDEGRALGLHPSALSHKNFCPRAEYYSITEVKESNPISNSLAMEAVYEIGHDSHRKYQNWLWDMGVLRGVFECLKCKLFFEEVSPHICPRCEAGKLLLVYREVPLLSEEYLIVGSADGDVWFDDEWILIEIKTIGARTIEIENPKLLKRFTYRHIDVDGKAHSNVDWRALWNGIRYPFPSHLKQGMIYCFCKGRKRIRFIYEPKFLTAWPKEFLVTFDKELIADILDECLIVKAALERGKPPRRPMWAEEAHTTCARCVFKDECYGNRRDSAVESTDDSSGSSISEEGSEPAPKARVRYTEAPY